MRDQDKDKKRRRPETSQETEGEQQTDIRTPRQQPTAQGSERAPAAATARNAASPSYGSQPNVAARQVPSVAPGGMAAEPRRFGSADGAVSGGTMAAAPVTAKVGAEEARKLMGVLRKYHAGLARTRGRIISSENWWKIRNAEEESRTTDIGKDGGFTSQSGWLHNVIVAKHADAMESYPEPNVLPREEGDKAEAQMLSAIVPCVLEQNRFEETYSGVMWQKLKYGTGVYKIIWDQSKLNGLGDIGIERVNLLNLYWEPGVEDIQKSRYLFHTELRDRELLAEEYPQLKDKLKSNIFSASKFLYDDVVSDEDKATVVECYYHKRTGGKTTLQYIKFVGDEILYATENDPEMQERGLYDHGKYPYAFDSLYPIEGSPCGYGYVDICKNPQTVIDLLKTATVKNAMVGATPRYFTRSDGTINEKELLDLSSPIVHVSGSLDETALRTIDYRPLQGNHIDLLSQTIQELRETSGNTETATGSTSSGVTAASAIAALQEASGKGSRDSTKGSYCVYREIVTLCIELIRQFYDMPRKFRITGSMGEEQFVTYSNAGLRPQHQGIDFGQDMGYRLPVFDIRVEAQKKSVYTKISQNELATQFFQLGFFNPNLTDQALMCLDIMDFDGREALMQKIAKQGTAMQKLAAYMQMALAMASGVRPDLVPAIQQDMAQTLGVTMPTTTSSVGAPTQADSISGIGSEENAIVSNAREQAAEASQPDSGRVISKKEET